MSVTAEPENRQFPTITDDALENLRQRIGRHIENTIEPWCYAATRDNIRRYAHGIGDGNPLWCDPDYASRTARGDIVALPGFLFATSHIISGYVGGLPGILAMWSGADWRWHRPARRNEEIRTEARLSDVVEHSTSFARRRSGRLVTWISTAQPAIWRPVRRAGAAVPTARWRASAARNTPM